MEFWIDKCAMLVIEKGKIVKSNSIQLPNDEILSHWKKERVISI